MCVRVCVCACVRAGVRVCVLSNFLFSEVKKNEFF